MKLNKISEAMAWLPGFVPGDGNLVVPSESAHATPHMNLPIWPSLEPSTFAGLSGDVTKYKANIAAIKLLFALEAEGRSPSLEEREILNRYTGWGGLSKAFNEEQHDKAWQERSVALRALLGEDHRSAENSTPNAHYTPINVIQSVYQAVEQLGFKGGRILDPSAGTGYFIGAMPKAMAERSQVTAIELDAISSRIMAKLYGDYGVKTLHGAFESTPLPEGYFDLAISNVPFGNYQVAEMRNVPYVDYAIHDYFFARSMELVRPGGLVAFITSSGTLDKHGDKVRHYLESKGDLIAAFRLPSSTFESLAGTSVTTDLIILQRRDSRSTLPLRNWMNVLEVHYGSAIKTNNYYSRLYVNEYYHRHPEHHIGAATRVSNGYSYTTGCVLDGDPIPLLKAQISRLPEGVYHAKVEDKAVKKAKLLHLDPSESHRPGYRLIKDVVYSLNGCEAVEYAAPKKTLARIAGMIAVRDAARLLVAAQISKTDKVVDEYRLAFNVAYDGFVKANGYLSTKVNRSAFKGDPDLPLLLSLEHWDPTAQKAEKSEIFSRRTVGVHQPVDSCDNTKDAMMVSLVEYGRIVPEHIGYLVGMDPKESMQELCDHGFVFFDPEANKWVTSDEYLSGNVRNKYTYALLAGEEYQRNAAALEAVIPKDLAFHEIGARIGSTWIPAQDYSTFLDETLGSTGHKVSFCKVAGAWDVSQDYTAHNVASTQTYGTSRVNAVTLFEMALNQTVPTVYDTDYDNKRVINQGETIAAREKQHDLKERFVAWLWEEGARTNRLVRLYNDTMNAIVPRQYDGSHLTLPGYSGVYALHQHQKDAIWRIIASGRNTLLAHAVGAGKTLTMICSAMELRRLGKINKALMVVPNHMLEQFGAEFLRAYPGANILLAGKEDLVGDKRRLLLSRIATGNWDAIVITHASFERLKMSEDFMRDLIEEEIQSIVDAIRSASTGSNNKIVKQLARARRTWEARLSKMENVEKKDDLVQFEELGIDWLYVDEAHYFKNLYRHTKMTRVAGLPNTNSERSFDMFCKTRHILSLHEMNAGVVFATGTPVSNSMAELWVMQRYLQPKTMERHFIDMFDTWAGNFGESVTALELSPDGSGYRMQTRFSRFVNLPELMAIFSEVADIRTAEMLELPVPKNDKHTVVCAPSETLKAYINGLVKRAEKVRNGEVRPKQDNMLSITNDGRMAALDIRLVMDGVDEDPGNKSYEAAKRILSIWHETKDEKAAQLVFSDLSTPKNDGTFDAYNDLKRKLVQGGIPEDEIAFIHDAATDPQKESIFAAVRAGTIRVIMGSTLKMGVGTNIQERLIALHHLDAPWRPSDVEQREGRIIRQGNLFDRVAIYRYVTSGSFDTYIWQTLENKARFIAQVMAGHNASRHVEDVALAALSFAEVKALASGNPMVLEKAGIDSELAKLNVLKAMWERQKWQNKQELISLPSTIEREQSRLSRLEADAALASQRDNSFCMEVNGIQYFQREEAGKALRAAKVKGINVTIGHFNGFAISYLKDHFNKTTNLVLTGQASHMANSAKNNLGLVMVLENTLNGMAEEVIVQRGRLQSSERRLVDIHSSLEVGFEHIDRINELTCRQREIELELDLMKGDHAATDDDSIAA